MDASPKSTSRRQQSMPEFVTAMEKSGLLVRILIRPNRNQARRRSRYSRRTLGIS